MNAKVEVCYYHGPNCADGWASCWLVKRAYPDCLLVPVNYGGGLPPAEQYAGKNVMVVDFSFPPDEMAVMASQARTVAMLDHHATAIRKWAGEQMYPGGFGEVIDAADGMRWERHGNVAILFDASRSGAMLTWDWLQANTNGEFFWDRGSDNEPEAVECPWLVRYVQDRDLWFWALPDSKAVSAYIRMQQQEVWAWDQMHDMLESSSGRDAIIHTGDMILAREAMTVDRAVAKAVDLVVGGFVVPVVNATEMISEIGNALSVGRPFSASYFDDNQVGMRRWSLRSQEDGEDVSKVAERFGGGGHPRAAGFQTPLPPLM